MKINPIKNLPVTNHLTHEVCFISSLNCTLPDKEIKQIISICNQPLIYKILFKKKLKGKPYTKKDAVKFNKWTIEGWKNQTNFVFIIKNKTGDVISCMDIKEKPPVSEIGYWSNANHPGIMTNAVKKLIKFAKKSGYKSLYARILPTNYKSQNLVKRVGFKYSTRVRYNQEKTLHHKYTQNL